jgi:redox-sensitive bicupin YhaK (pirin superfamily)
MNRKEFIKKSVILGAMGAVTPSIVQQALANRTSDYDKLIQPIGFNHLPNKEEKTMNTVLHKASTRGHADHGWLKSNHTFSFANYYNPERVHFGVLRVLNDDIVAGGKGFSTHPHDNMEIISIPLEGDLEHKDSMGNVAVIKEGDVQVLSAGTGIYHSEYNKNTDQEVKFLQIWVFPNKKQVTPRYDQLSLADTIKENELSQILSPSPDDQGVWIHQDAWFSLGSFTEQTELTYELHKPTNGVYAFVLEGNLSVNGQDLSRRDGFGIWDVDQITVTAEKNAKVLLMEVPMSIEL